MNNEQLKTRLEMVTPIVKQAGEIILSFMNKEKNVQYKGEIDMVTAADKESEKFLVAALSENFPDDGIQAEEGAAKASRSGCTWVIDPLDGTTSFTHHFPMFAVSAGLVDENRKPILGLVYNPFYKELFYAWKGGGAFLNGEPIHVSSAPSLSKSLIGTGFPYTRRNHMDEILNRLGKILYKVHDVRRTGSAALDLSFVACGRLDGYYETGLNPWDVAAGIIIIEEAGGKCGLFDGSPVNIDIPQTLASNGKIHVELLEIMQSNLI